jgi:hypothetical protein
MKRKFAGFEASQPASAESDDTDDMTDDETSASDEGLPGAAAAAAADSDDDWTARSRKRLCRRPVEPHAVATADPHAEPDADSWTESVLAYGPLAGDLSPAGDEGAAAPAAAGCRPGVHAGPAGVDADTEQQYTYWRPMPLQQLEQEHTTDRERERETERERGTEIVLCSDVPVM